jgi:uncharacterized membrane protein (UPF0127 family)
MSSARRRWFGLGSVVVVGAALALPTLIMACGCSGDTVYKPYEAGDESRSWKLGGVDVTLEIADNREERERGLMFRRTMPADHGMLFVYPSPEELHFWMRNTAIPLSIAFILEDADGKSATIVNIEDMQPYVEMPGAISEKPVRFALEMNQGWFAKHGLKNGSKLDLPTWISSIVASGDDVKGN